jgi:hypothetical protein
MALAYRQSALSVSNRASTGKENARPGDQEMANFDLRDVLADITVRETSFTEFLAALRQAGYHPA